MTIRVASVADFPALTLPVRPIMVAVTGKMLGAASGGAAAAEAQRTLSVPRSEVATVTPVASKRLNSVRLL